MRRIPVNGVHLHVAERGYGPPLLLLHGFTGDATTWDRFARDLAVPARIVAVDLLGHGRSDAPAEPERYRMERCVEDLLALLDELGVHRFDLLGYSMGGRVALNLALAAPDRVRALILESATAGIQDPEERRQRREADEALAAFIEREGIEAFVQRWEELPLFASQKNLPAEVREAVRRQRLANSPRGLAGSLRGMGAGAMEPVWDRLPQLAMPVLLLSGELDPKYCALSRQMQELIPGARWVVVQGAGHNVHLERPDAFRRAVEAFLRNRTTY